MSKKHIAIGIIFIVIGIWIYSAMSSLEIERGPDYKKLIIKEGEMKSESEVAAALAYEMGFDLEGAYRSGYIDRDIIEYLSKESHSFSLTFFQGRFYMDRFTVPYVIPKALYIIFFIAGTAIIVFKGIRRKKSR